MCFGQESLHKSYILLAVGSRAGTVAIYRCYRTKMELALLSDKDFMQNNDLALSVPPAAPSNVTLHVRCIGHKWSITSILFNLLGDRLVTTSLDKSVCFWETESGQMLKVFNDRAAVTIAAFMPFNEDALVIANTRGILRVIDVLNGLVRQRFSVGTEVRALKFDNTRRFLFAGTKQGILKVLQHSSDDSLAFKFQVQVAVRSITCITYVPANYGHPPFALVNTADGLVSIMDCIYEAPTGDLTNLVVRQRVNVAHTTWPIKSCYSSSGQGYLISGSEDSEVHIYSLAQASKYKKRSLKHHQDPVVAVALNSQDTLLATGDIQGRIVLWRRADFSHLQD